MQKISLFLFLSLLISACGETTPPDPCDPEKGQFIKGHRYISADFLREDGSFDYKKWSEYYEKKRRFQPNPNCIPLEEDSTLKEKIEKLEDTIDLFR
ncbi:MAG: hypothetical protein D6767_11005 [Candidatus Hydrogenedentota bacterium]|nr:MAG: hypothetical protein D6767_11005 [Candidatus Hydrogenedentota bacterium]